MRNLDWIVIAVFVGFSVFYGIWKGRGARTLRGFLLADKSMPWYAFAM